MNLPFADEIRATRTEVEACHQASLLNQYLSTALTALSILEVQHRSGMPLPPELPGDDVVARAAQMFPSLVDLARHSAPSGTTEVRLRARHQQLTLVQQHLAPVLAVREDAASRLHDLQNRQHHALHAPEWAEVVSTLKELGLERDALSTAMSPLQHQIALVLPVQQMVAQFHPQLEAELVEAARTEDPAGVVAWRAAMIAHQQLVGLAQVIEQMGLVLQYPYEPMLPDAPHPRHRRRLRQEAGTVLEWMVTLNDSLSAHCEVLQARMDGLHARHAQVETMLKERMG